MAIEILELTGGGGRSIPAELVSWAEKPLHGVVMLPGVGYTCQMPVFYYIEAMALQSGAAVVAMDAIYRDDQRFQPTVMGEAQRDWLGDDARAAVRALLERHDVQELNIVAKLLTTIGLAAADWTEIARDRTVRLIWLTPLLGVPDIITSLTTTELPSLVSIGTNDHVYDPDAIERLRDRPTVMLDVIDGADHSYGHGPDIDRSLATVGQIVRSVRQFAFGHIAPA